MGIWKAGTLERRKIARPGAVLVYSLLVLSTLLIVVTGFSLYVVRAIRTLAISSDTAVANYVAESAVEEGLFLLRREGVQVTDLGTPYDRWNSEGGLLEAADPLASIASSTATYDGNDLRFVAASAFAELRSTSTVNEIIMDVAQDDVAFADVYDASRESDLIGTNIASIKVEWDQGSGASWLEASLVELNAQVSGAELQQPRTQVLGPSLHSGYCFSDLQSGGTVNIHRLRFRALFDSIRNLRITGFRATDCDATGSYPVALPGRTTVSATGRFHQAKQTVQISMPQQTLPSGLFGFVVFSDQSLTKLSAGVGNLQLLPTIPNGFVWPDGVSGPASTFRFTYPAGAGVPSQPSSTVEVLPGAFGTEDVPVFTLVNTERSGSFETGDIILSASANYANLLELDYSFGANLPSYPAADPATKLCSDPALRGPGGYLRLAQPGTVREVSAGDPPSVVDRYYVDRCAVGVRLDPVGVTAASPLRGRLVAYADPGGTASLALEYNPPVPVLRVEREQSPGTWAAVTNNTTYGFGSVPVDTTEVASFRICNVGADGTSMVVGGDTVSVSGSGFASPEAAILSASLAPAGSDCSAGPSVGFTVQFNPDAGGSYSGSLQVEPEPAAVQPFYLTLTGSGSVQPTPRIAITTAGYTGVIDGTSNPYWWRTANSLCSQNLGGRWKALLWAYNSGGSPYLPQPTVYSGVRYVNMSGQTLFTAAGENQVPSSLQNPVSTSNVGVWTGYTSSNQQCRFNGKDWARGTVNEDGRTGLANSITATWLSSSTLQCSNSLRLYCVESLENIDVSPRTYDFGVLPNGVTQQTAEISITNSGTGDLRIESLSVSGAAFEIVSPPATPFTIPAAGESTVTVRFTRASPGTDIGSLTVVSTDADEPSIVVPIMGSGAGTVRYRIAVTSNQINGNIQAYSAAANWWDDANQFCNDDPAIAAMGGTWRALLWGVQNGPPFVPNGSTYLPQTVTQNGRSYANESGELLFVSAGVNAIPNSLYHPVTPDFRVVWAGAYDYRWHCQSSNQAAMNWVRDTAPYQATQGVTNEVDDGWIAYSIGQCQNTRHLYCVEQ